jgi:hypothetical protein
MSRRSLLPSPRSGRRGFRFATELFEPPCLFVGHEADQGGSRSETPGALGLLLPKDRLRLGAGSLAHSHCGRCRREGPGSNANTGYGTSAPPLRVTPSMNCKYGAPRATVQPIHKIMASSSQRASGRVSRATSRQEWVQCGKRHSPSGTCEGQEIAMIRATA